MMQSINVGATATGKHGNVLRQAFKSVADNMGVLFSRPNGAGAKIACIGSSLTQHSTNFNAEYIKNDARGYMSWLNVLSGQRFYYAVWPNEDGSFFHGSNKGVSGQFSWEILSRVDDVINMGVDVCIVQNSSNEMGSDTYENIISNCEKIIERFNSAGVFVISVSVLPREVSSWPAGSESRIKRNRVNAWKRDYSAKNPGVVFVDIGKYMIDPSDTQGQPYAGMLWDGIHTAPKGAFAISKALMEVIDTIYPPVSSMIFGADNVYDATHNPDGNLLISPTFIGTGGGNGAGSSGVVPSNWRVERYAGTGATVVNSVIHSTVKNARMLQMVITPGGSNNETFHFRTNASTTVTGVEADKWYQGELDIEVDGGYAGIKAISLVVDDVSAGGVRGVDLGEQSGHFFPAENWNGRLKTPPVLTKSSDGLRYRLEIIIDGTVSGSPVIRVSQPVMRQVESPVTVLNGG